MIKEDGKRLDIIRYTLVSSKRSKRAASGCGWVNNESRVLRFWRNGAKIQACNFMLKCRNYINNLISLRGSHCIGSNKPNFVGTFSRIVESHINSISPFQT